MHRLVNTMLETPSPTIPAILDLSFIFSDQRFHIGFLLLFFCFFLLSVDTYKNRYAQSVVHRTF